MKLYLLIMILYSNGGQKFEFSLYRLNAACEAMAQTWRADIGGDAYCSPILLRE